MTGEHAAVHLAVCSPAHFKTISDLKGKTIMGDWKLQDDLKYTKSDEWIRVEGGEAVIGITDFAQDQLSDLVYVELPEVGETFTAGQEFGVVESVKASAPLKMPVSGEIVAVNSDLEGNEGVINEDPYGKGWIVRIRLSNPAELNNLLDVASYGEHQNARG
jgi:glycine cleavage system H protein